MTPEEYIEELRAAQRTLDMVKEDLDRAIDKMQRRIETGYEHLEKGKSFGGSGRTRIRQTGR